MDSEPTTVIYMRIPEWLHAELERIAEEDDRSLNKLVVTWHRDTQPASGQTVTGTVS